MPRVGIVPAFRPIASTVEIVDHSGTLVNTGKIASLPPTTPEIFAPQAGRLMFCS
jgi:hypothetical protein